MIEATRPTFTVVIPLFDKGAHIAATLASVVAQTFVDYEVLVVDDGSRDDGPALVEAIGGRVRLLRQNNAGPGVARNRGIAQANGTWIAFLDADDLWYPSHLATLAHTIETCPDADIVATGYERATVARLGAGHAAAAAVDQPRYIDFFCDYDLVWTSAVAVRASALAVERFGAAWPGEDVDLWTRLALRHRFAIHPAVTAVYIQRTGGAMDSQHSAVAVAVANQPVFMTLAAVLDDPDLAGCHAAAGRLRAALLLDYTRPALFNGHTALARQYLRALRHDGGGVPASYWLLAQLPGPVARAGSRAYGRIKRVLGR